MSVDKTVVYADGRQVSTGSDPAAAVAEAQRLGGFAWIALRRPGPAELHDIGELLDLPRTAVADSLRGHARSKLVHHDRATYLVLHPARYVDETESVLFTEVDIFLVQDAIVTVVDEDVADLYDAQHLLDQHPEVMRRGTFAVVWALFEQLFDAYLPVLDGVENDIDEIELQLFNRAPEVTERIFKLEREVIALQHATLPLADMLDRMQRIVRHTFRTEETPAFADADDRARHLDDRVRGFRETLNSALTVNATLAEEARNAEMQRLTEFGIQQNDQVKKISSWAAILFAPTLVGTIYGMNFKNMPELDWTFGYPLALLAMLGMGITLYVVFKRRGWL